MERYPSCTSGRGSAWLERLVRDQEAGGSNPLAPTNPFNNLEGLTKLNSPPICPPSFKVAAVNPRYVYCGYGRQLASQAFRFLRFCDLLPLVDINFAHGRKPQPEKLTGTEAPEGWIRKIDRPREGKVWVGFFHLYDRRLWQSCAQKEGEDARAGLNAETRGAAEAGRIYRGIHRQADSPGRIDRDIRRSMEGVLSREVRMWAKKMKEDLRYLFAKHVLPIIGEHSPRVKITLTPLQLLL